MKNLRYIFSLLSLIAFAACDNGDEQIIDPEAPLPKVSFNISAEVPDSRTALTQGEDGIYRAIWKSGDKIRIAQIADSSAVEYSDHILTEDAEKVEIIASFSQSSASQFTYVLASPSVVVNEDFSTLSLTLPAEQTPSALETFDGNADILISDALNLETQPTGQSIDFDVNRLSAVGKMTITNLALTDGDKVTSVTFTASQPLAGTIKNIYTSNLVAGKLQTTDFTFTDSSNSVKVNLPQAQSGSFTYFMCCLPTTLSTGEQYSVTVRTEQGRYTKSATIPTPLEFIEGQITSCTINMSGIALDTTPEDETTTYNIGDLVTINGTKGVVFQTTPNIKIVSAEEASLQWGSASVLGVQTGAISTTDGAYNMSIIKAISDYENNYPAFKWCADLGEDWYLPSYEELFGMYNDLSVVNKTLTDNGFSALASQESVYWSSSEYVDSSNNYAHNVNLSTGAMNIDYKNTTKRVRAVLAIGDNPADVDLSLYADLSAEGTANCYLVQAAGNYKFKAVKGNSTESVGAAQSAKVLWETFGTDVTPSVGELVADAGYKDDYIYFSTPATFNNGNASIAVYDANGTILWSWHIWCSAEGWSDHVYANNAVTMMDRNLGATSATPGNVGALGLLYQWGRKDPFLSSISIFYTNIDAASTITFPSAVTSTSATGTIEYATSNPTTFIIRNTGNNDWYYTGDSSTDNTRWMESEKTMYDPCPVGYRVPKGGESGFWATALGASSSTSEGTTWDDTNKGRHWPLADGTTAWYPAVGNRYYGSGELRYVGSYGYYWSASPKSSSSHAYGLDFDNGYVGPTSNYSRGHGYSVRCVQDIEVVPEPDDPATSQILYTSTDGNVVTPFSSTVFGANIVSNTYDSSLGLGTITFDGEVTQIGVRAFDGCTTLSGITIPQSVTTIGMMAFEETALSSITIPDNVTTIGEYAFRYCSSLKEFKGNYASEDGRCLVLNGVLNSFASAEIDTYIIPNDITAIGDGAFANSTLSSVTLPESITLIGSSAFSVCHNLTSINIPAAVTAIDNWAFFMCDKLAEVNITDLSAWFRIEFGGEVNANPLSYSNSVVLMLNGEKITDNIVIPEDITELKNYALHGYDSFTNVVLHSGITAIGNGTFKECNNLNSITLPASITTIGIDAFYACTALTSVYSTPTTPPTLGERAFQKWGDGDYANLDCKIYVPAASVNAYKTANGWNTYADAIVADSGDTTIAGFEMVFVAGGTFTMGATSEQGSDADSYESPTHSVTLSDYYIGKYEVTQAQWKAVMGSNPSQVLGDDLPVECVSWNNIQTFISKLNEQTGMNFRLPTEAEWEFAARGGNNSKGYKYSGSNTIDDVAWYTGNSSKTVHPIGQKQPNELGIYDMSGNVWEWCQDWYGSYSSSAQTNPTGPSSGPGRVMRGGSWCYDARICRVSLRNYLSSGQDLGSYGFRLACRHEP